MWRPASVPPTSLATVAAMSSLACETYSLPRLAVLSVGHVRPRPSEAGLGEQNSMKSPAAQKMRLRCDQYSRLRGGAPAGAQTGLSIGAPVFDWKTRQVSAAGISTTA